VLLLSFFFLAHKQNPRRLAQALKEAAAREEAVKLEAAEEQRRYEARQAAAAARAGAGTPRTTSYASSAQY